MCDSREQEIRGGCHPRGVVSSLFGKRLTGCGAVGLPSGRGYFRGPKDASLRSVLSGTVMFRCPGGRAQLGLSGRRFHGFQGAGSEKHLFCYRMRKFSANGISELFLAFTDAFVPFLLPSPGGGVKTGQLSEVHASVPGFRASCVS